jgi:hypothetical protein
MNGSNSTLLKLIARTFLIVASLLGIAYLGAFAFCLYDGFSDPKSFGLLIIGFSIIPACFGFYLLYGYFSICCSRSFKGSPKLIWILTFIFNLIGVLSIPHVDGYPVMPLNQHILYYAQYWPHLATILSGIAIYKLMTPTTKGAS